MQEANVDLSARKRLSAFLNGSAPDIGVLWEICSYFEWADRDKTVDSIAGWLGPAEGLTVLDCACGSGFPGIDLRKRGYEVTCSDGSELMLEHFRRNAERQGVSPEATQSRWEELSTHHGEGRFDVVMCRGCSFLYAGTWDADAEPDRTILATAMRQFVACVKPGGRLYIDIARAADLDDPEPQWTPQRTLIIGDHRVELREVVRNHPDKDIRVWHSWLEVDGRSYEFERRSHFLRHEQLVDLMTTAGLVDVRPETVAGEHYEVYAGHRPD